MADVQTPVSDEERQNSRLKRPRPVQPRRARSLWGQISTVILQPATFFRSLPNMQENRQWFWVALIILALVALSAVQRDSLTGSEGEPGADGFMGAPAGQFDAPFIEGPPVGPPLPGPTAPTSDASDVSARWTTALLAGGGMVLGWLVLAVFLSEVTLLRGEMPRFDRNLQIAIWASVPLGLMAGLQLLFYAAGGGVGALGVSGLLDEIPAYAQLPPLAQEVIRSLASQLTLFWLWSLLLIYIGARQALRGKHWAIALVLTAWIVVLVLAPAVADRLIGASEEAAVTPEPGVLPGAPVDEGPQTEGVPMEGPGYGGQEAGPPAEEFAPAEPETDPVQE